MKKILCILFGHNWVLKPKPDIFSRKRKCEWCNKKQFRVKYPVFSVEDIWKTTDSFDNLPPQTD